MSFIAALMQGLGDTILARPVVRQARVDRGPFFVATTYPQLFADIAVHCVPLASNLRNQKANLERYPHLFVHPKHAMRSEVWRYESADIVGGNMSMLQSLSRRADVHLRDAQLSLPPVQPHGLPLPEPYLVFRPASVREEWNGAARNPDPRYLDLAVQHMRGLRYSVVSVAAIGAGEQRVGRKVLCDVHYDDGQLSPDQIMSVVCGSKGIIGGVGFATFMAIAAKVPMLCILGGNGAYNNPRTLLDARWSARNLVLAVPDRLCPCGQNNHACVKTISHFDDRLIEFARVVHEHARPGPRVEL